MGYYINIHNSTARIPAENVDEAYRRLCALNHTVPNSEKRGGRYPHAEDMPAVGPHPDSWFSWMDWNYDEKCENVADVLAALGFEVYVNDDGSVNIDYYDSKAGQEDLFLDAISDLMTGDIEWRGEDGALWRTIFGGKSAIEEQGTVVYG